MGQNRSRRGRGIGRLHCQSGLALVMALGVMTVLGMVGSTVIFYATENSGEATLSAQQDGAYALAEAGINDALAKLAAPGTNPFNPYALGQQTTTYDNGTATWWGTLDETSGTWTINAVGTTRKPGGGAPAQRHESVSLPVYPAPQQTPNSSWNYIYSRSKGLTCDMTIANSVQVNAPLYVSGNLCMQNTATITKGPLYVGGRITMSQSTNAVGSLTNVIAGAHVVGGCKWYTNLLHSPCQYGAGLSGFDNIWASPLDNTPGTAAPPLVNWDAWYLNADPGPYYPCENVAGTPPVFDNDQGPRTSPDATKRNDSLNTSPSFNLTPASSYTCKTAAGELSWDAVNRVLTVNGTIFIDGSAQVTNGLVNSYVGVGSLYLSGTFFIKNSALCAVVSGDGTGCTTTGWNPNTRLLMIAANGNGSFGGAAGQVIAGDSIQLVSGTFQGAMYGTYIINLDTTSRVDGPMDGSTVQLGQSVNSNFPPISLMPAGTPGTSPVYGTLGTPNGYNGG
jgi:hypothetical protein